MISGIGQTGLGVSIDTPYPDHFQSHTARQSVRRPLSYIVLDLVHLELVLSRSVAQSVQRITSDGLLRFLRRL